VADKRCENGHFIDEAWDICPYCPQDDAEPEIPVVRPRTMEGGNGAQPGAAPAPPAPPAQIAQPIPQAVPQPNSQPNPQPRPHAAAPAPRPLAIPSAPAAPPLRPRSPGTSPSAVAVPPQERTVAAQRIDMAQVQKRYVVGWLVGLNGTSRGEAFPVRMGRNVIGRDRRSDIIIEDDQASSHHADLVFRPEERRFILMDHNSTNGTYVNEAEIEPRRDLIEKDVIRIGSHRFVFAPLCHDGFHWDDEGPLK
jgi:hypothetical protein